MGHSCGAEGACVIDYLSYLETWVENGKAPNAIIGVH
ncbi:MAG: Tannase and feruloyl esterase, partial [Gammaproteobacteria bacterium]|nr:Tannase and feruloyl esterase [Gammaproteobacteria bacterium]